MPNIQTISQNILKPLIQKKILSFEEKLKDPSNSDVQKEYFSSSLLKLQNSLSQPSDVTISQPLNKSILTENVLSCELSEQKGCFLIYNIETAKGKLKAEINSITLQVVIHEQA